MPDKKTKLNLLCDTSHLSTTPSSIVEEVFGKFEDYCNETKVSPILTIRHFGETDITSLWNLVDNASNHSIELTLEVHNTDCCIIRPMTHLISQINITGNFDAFLVQKMDVKSYLATFDEKIDYLREMNPNICIGLVTEVDFNNFNLFLKFNKTNDNFIFDKWQIFRSSKISDFQFFSFVRNNYGYTDLVSKSNTFIRNEIMPPSLTFQSDCHGEAYGARLAFQNNISDHYLAYHDYSACIHDTKSLLGSFDDCLRDIKFETSKIDNRDEKRVTSHVIKEMEKFFHLR